MAVTLERTTVRYIGLSLDTKPGASDGVTAGSSFYENDTGEVYRFDGSSWKKKPKAEEVQSAILDAVCLLRREVAALRLGMIANGQCADVGAEDVSAMIESELKSYSP